MFLQTSYEEKHAHFVNVSENTLSAECGRVKKHRHVIEFSQEEQQFRVLPADDGHTHILEELTVIEPKLPSIEDNLEADVIASQTLRYQEAHDAERLSVERGQESIDFREGKQWPDETLRKLNSENRAALTINHVAPMIESLSGVARQQRTDIKVFPVEGGDQFVADILTQTIKQILTQNDFAHEEIEVFEDEISAGRGVMEVYPDYDENLEGNIKVRHIPWDMVSVAPHLRKDIQDAEYMFKWKWVSKNQLTNLYPDSQEDISNLYTRLDLAYMTGGDTLSKDSVFKNTTFVNNQTKQIKLLECESKEYYVLKLFVDTETADVIAEDSIPKDLAKQLSTLNSLRFVKRRLFRLRRTVSAGDKVLEDDYLDSPTLNNSNGNAFSTIIVYAYKRGLYFEGKIQRVKDPQRELNKRRSQTVDIVNTSINNGWFYEEGTFNNLQDEDNFKQNSSTAGFTQKVEDITRVPIKVEAGVVERGIVELEQNSQRSFREVSNINMELLGQAPSYQSGVALQQQQRQALVGNEYLFDNMNRGKKELGRRLIAWIQKIYTPERIARLVLNQAVVDKVFISGQPLDPQNQEQVQMFMQKAQMMLANDDLVNYDIGIGESNSTPTTQLANLQMMQQLAQAGVPIPPTALLEMSPIPNKERIMQQIQQQQQAEQEAEDKKYNTELQKTMIAQQGKQQGGDK